MELFVLEVSEDQGKTWRPWTFDPYISADSGFVQAQVDFRTAPPNDGKLLWRVGTYVRKES